METNREQNIFEILENECKKKTNTNKTVSGYTKNAKLTARNWQNKCLEMIKGVRKEVKISDEIVEKIDLVDENDNTAYEFKYSGKNISHEFYKDLIKILLFNQFRPKESKIAKFFFISEKDAIQKFLEKEKLISAIRKEFSSIKIAFYGVKY